MISASRSIQYGCNAVALRIPAWATVSGFVGNAAYTSHTYDQPGAIPQWVVATGTSPCNPDQQSYIIFVMREGI
jgi:hypothetical protein